MSIVSHLVIFPVEIILSGLGRALRNFFEIIPTQWQFGIFVMVVILSVLGIIMWCGYSIRLPFISLEPGRVSRSVIKKEKDQTVSADNNLVKME